jgi:hypothetical protein
VGGAGSVFARRLKKPNLAALLGLGTGAGAGRVLDLLASCSFCMSGVEPRESPREPDVGPGEGIRDGVFAGTAIRDREAGLGPDLESEDPVRLCEEGNIVMLLWTTGEGPRSPRISGVPSLLGLDGRRSVDDDAGG